MIAVTGASGRLGQWVVARLTADGHDVLCLSRRPLAAPTIAGLSWTRPVRTLACDLSDPAAHEAAARALRDAEGVVHAAGCVPEDTWRNADEDADETLRSNVVATARLLRSLEGCRRLRAVVMAGTFEVYGRPLELPVAEHHPTRPQGYYGAGKLAAEKLLALFGSDRRVACCSLRMPAVYGPGDTLRRALGNFVRAAAAGRPLVVHGDGADRRDLVYAADAAEAVALALQRAPAGPINLGAGAGWSVREMAETVLRAARGRGAGAAGGREVPGVEHRERTKPRWDYVADIGLAAALLGWRPRTSLEEGVRAQLDWELSRGNAASA